MVPRIVGDALSLDPRLQEKHILAGFPDGWAVESFRDSIFFYVKWG